MNTWCVKRKLDGCIISRCTSLKLAFNALGRLPAEVAKHCEVVKEKLPINTVFNGKELIHLTVPRPVSETMAHKDADNRVDGFVHLSLHTLINEDLDAIDDLISQSLTGDLMLMDIEMQAIGVDDEGRIILAVNGDASECG